MNKITYAATSLLLCSLMGCATTAKPPSPTPTEQQPPSPFVFGKDKQDNWVIVPKDYEGKVYFRWNAQRAMLVSSEWGPMGGIAFIEKGKPDIASGKLSKQDPPTQQPTPRKDGEK